MKNNKKICMLLLSLLLIIVIFATIILLVQTFLNIKEIEKNMVLEISGEEGNILTPKGEVVYNEKNIIKLLEKNINGFDGDEYEVDTVESSENVYPVIELRRKIGNFYTGDGFVVIIEDGKIAKVIDHRDEIELTDEEKKELREFKLSEEKIREYKEKAIGGGSIDPDDERVYYRLSYDRETKKKYIEVIVPVIDVYGDTVSLRNEEYEL